MIYRENYIKNFMLNDTIEERKYNDITNYKYALSLTPRQKSFKKPNRIYIKENGQYRLNRYYPRNNSKIPKAYSKTPMRFTKNNEFYKGNFKTEPNCKILPDIYMISKYKIFTTNDNDKYDHTKLNHIQTDDKIYKDVALGTDDLEEF